MSVSTRTADPARWLTVAEVAERLGIGPSRVYKLLRGADGQPVLRSVRVGGMLRIDAGDLEEYAENRPARDAAIRAGQLAGSIRRALEHEHPLNLEQRAALAALLLCRDVR